MIIGRPMIHSAEDAVGVFLTTGIDVLVLEDVVLGQTIPAGRGSARPDVQR